MSNVKLDDMMRKIKGLLANADDPATPSAAADTFRAKAEQLMQKYRIEEEHLRESGALYAETITPKRDIIVVCPAGNPFFQTYYNLAVYAIQHTGVRGKYNWQSVDGIYSLVMDVVGFESDIRYADMLFQSARIVFADRMEPKYKADLSDEDNVYAMRNAGLERGRIGQLMGWGGEGTQGPNKVTRVYKKACAQRGEEAKVVGRDFNVKVFREQYSQGFVSEFWSRLYNARNAATTGGADLVLHNRKDAVDEAFYEHFPNLRPKAEIDGGPKSKRRAARWTKADQARADRAYSKAGQAGSGAGRQAAKEVDLGGRKAPGRLT
jgi:hypothetical protein